ncbi:MAG: excinuclease ABC subunit A, partial [Actinomycetospora chiangmaiensis]|nr:excinuclease ABC subunit A [Actinomycetospora chiangmaiensis]
MATARAGAKKPAAREAAPSPPARGKAVSKAPAAKGPVAKEPAAKKPARAVAKAEAAIDAKLERLFDGAGPPGRDQRVISVRGAREHNLKNVDLTIPRDRLVVFTGLSGSGKSSLAFDTIYAEGQRRYVESLSSYARQFL